MGKKTKRPSDGKKKTKKDKSKQETSKNEQTNIISYEGYKKSKIIELNDISEFNLESQIELEPPEPDLTLFQTKDLAQKYFLENKYNIESILQYDDTNKQIQEKYLSIAVNKLNSNNKKEMLNIIQEKIEKCGIILDKKVYEDEIKTIKDENIRKNLEYIDYRLSIINTLTYIKENKNGNANEAQKKLLIKKIFSFNHESTLGNNNYYFYGLAMQLSMKLEEIFSRYPLHIYIVNKSLEFFRKNFSELSENDIYKFKYISFVLTDKNSIKNRLMFENIKNFLEGKPISDMNKLKQAIENTNKNELKKNNSEERDNIIYNINFNNNFIKYMITENTKIDRKNFSENYIKKYRADIFNEQIINTINNMNSLENFESEIFANVLPEKNYSYTFYKDYKKIIFDVLEKILQSESAKKFFFNIYENKYNKDNKKIKYHFGDKKFIEEIISRIEFYPIFDPETKANTNPTDLTIIINSIPGKFSLYEEINCFNKKILQIGRIIIFLIHEIFGHFLRRYYSFITGGIIKMDTNEDNLIDTKPESGFYIEKNFLGFETETRLYLKDALYLLFYEDNYENYPIIKKEKKLTENDLKIIIKGNIELFDFIVNNSTAKVEEEKIKKKDNQKDEDKEAKKKEHAGKIREIKEETEEEDDVEDPENKEEEEKKETKKMFNKEKKELERKFLSEKPIKNNKITIEQYYNSLNPVKVKYPSIISCGFRKGESYIEF